MDHYVVECPSGYFYAGDDTKEEVELKSYWKIATSPVYSCYKRLPGLSGINEGLEKCYNSVSESDNMEARVVSFESREEVNRVFNYINDNFHLVHSDEIVTLTSAMSFKIPDSEDSQWIYLGTSKYRYSNYVYLRFNAKHFRCEITSTFTFFFNII